MKTALLLCLTLWSGVALPQTPTAGRPLVFFTIFGVEAEPLQRFYSELFDWKLDKGGRFDTTAAAPLSGQIGKSVGAEVVIYVGVADITATLAKAQTLGGSIRYPRFEVPGVAVLGVLKDPAGNSVGLVEMVDGKAKVPQPPASPK
jgi:predicted enzyme related to lactoylglutathione lyase